MKLTTKPGFHENFKYGSALMSVTLLSCHPENGIDACIKQHSYDPREEKLQKFTSFSFNEKRL